MKNNSFKGNILILINSSLGLILFRRNLVNRLLDTYQVSIGTADTGRMHEIEETGCALNETEMDRRSINPIKDLKLFFKYLSIIKKEKPDHVITYTIKPNIYGGMAARLKRVPYVANITGLGTAFEGSGLIKRIVTRMYKTALKKAKVVFFENSANRDTMVNLGIVEEARTHVLPGAGVDLEHFQYQEYPQDDNGLQFLFVGRIMKEKGMDELLGVFRKLNKVGNKCYLNIVGTYEEDYSQIFAEYDSEGWLRYHGQQSDVRPFINSCHCFVLPSYHEGMANTNLECAASGRPLITSNIPGCREAVLDGVSGLLCEPKDEDSLYDAIKRMTELSWEQRQAMGVAGRRHTEEVFDKEKVVEETIKVMGI